MMKATDVKNTADLRTLVESRPELNFVHVAVVDHTGQLRGKTVSVEKLLKSLDGGMPFTPNFAAADTTDEIFPIEGIFEGDVDLHDAQATPVAETLCEIPWESPQSNLLVLMNYTDEASAFACPRSLLLLQVESAKEMGLEFFGSFEMEFRLFEGCFEENRAKKFRDLKPVPDRMQTYGILPQQMDAEYHSGLLELLVAMGMDIECYHSEAGAGFHELVLRYQPGMKAADNCALVKTFTKAYAQRNERLASFMARPLDGQDGSSFHSHLSLRDLEGNPVFFDASQPHNISQTMRHFIGGLQVILPELQLLMAPTANSYRRFQPGCYAPISTTWGLDNRTVGLRVMGNDSPQGIRVENRLPGADANPYLVHAATLAAGMWGIKHQREPGQLTTGNSWEKMDVVPEEQKLSDDMGEAIERFRQSDLAREVFGDEFIKVFAANREFHHQQYQEFLSSSTHDKELISDWELQRLFELA